jgi:hypothetical protein
LPEKPIHATEVKDLVLRHVFDDAKPQW